MPANLKAEEPKNQSKPIRFGLTIADGRSTQWGFPHYKIEVPTEYIPQDPNNRDNPILHKKLITTGAGGISFGPKVELFSILSLGIKCNAITTYANLDSPYTYWGGYGTGNYACIGLVKTKQELFSYDITINTPSLHLNEDTVLRAFISYVPRNFDLHYKSGYHMWGKAFYKVVDDFKIGEFESEGWRYGLELLVWDIGSREATLAFFYQNTSIDGSLTEKGKDFKYDKNQDLVGFTVGFNFSNIKDLLL